MLSGAFSLTFLFAVTVSKFGNAAVVQLSEADKEEFVKTHNEWRTIAGATSMLKIKWNDDLAKLAESVASTCVYAHSADDKRRNVLGFKYIGENSFARSDPQPSGKDIVDKWGKEIENYDVQANTCAEGKMCGHYTQVTWSSSSDIGCAIVQCDSVENFNSNKAGYLAFCEYGPGGNMQGEKPYETGALGSKCKEAFNLAADDHGLCAEESQAGEDQPVQPTEATKGPEESESTDAITNSEAPEAPTDAPTAAPTESEASSNEPTDAPTQGPSDAPSGSSEETPVPTEQPELPSTESPLVSDSTDSPTVGPSEPSEVSTDSPTSGPSEPSDVSDSPTFEPSEAPTDSPTVGPSEPSEVSTDSPTFEPSEPSEVSTDSPTFGPSEPWDVSTDSPTFGPSEPWDVSTDSPTFGPSEPWDVSTDSPTFGPSEPWDVSTDSPTFGPSEPWDVSTEPPTFRPSEPSEISTEAPTFRPTEIPTEQPTKPVTTPKPSTKASTGTRTTPRLTKSTPRVITTTQKLCKDKLTHFCKGVGRLCWIPTVPSLCPKTCGKC